MNELLIQRQILGYMRSIGGYGRKWATMVTVGVPDLIMVRNGHTLFAEVKYERDVPASFKRTIDLTPKQCVELNAINKASNLDGARGIVIVVLEWKVREGAKPERWFAVMDPPSNGNKLVLTSSSMIGGEWKNITCALASLTGGGL